MGMIKTLTLITLLLLAGVGIAAAQAPTETDLTSAVAILNNITTTIIVLLVVIGVLVLLGGLFLFTWLRRLDKNNKDLRQRVGELVAAYRELQNARKRIDGQLSDLHLPRTPEPTIGSTLELETDVRETMGRMAQAVALLPIGAAQYEAQDYLSALATYRQAADLGEDNPLAHYRAGYINIQVNQLDRAMGHLNHALDIDPNFTSARATLGYLYRRMAEGEGLEDHIRANLLDEAERHLSDALSQNRRLTDEDGEAWVATLAGVYRRRRQYDLAVRSYAEAAEYTPFSSYPYAALALVFADKNDHDQMFKQYERVEWRSRNEVASRPTSPWGHINLLLARLALGRDGKLVEEAFTLTFLSLPKGAAFVLPTLTSSLRRMEWALAGAGHQGRAERVAGLIQRIQRLEESQSPHSTQVLRASDVARATDAVRRVNNGKRATGNLPMTRPLQSTSEEIDFEFED
jgi:tetratricopeptide (TPR) repeat protein